MNQVNCFAVSVTDGQPVIRNGHPVALKEDQWRVPLGECIGCGENKTLMFSPDNPPDFEIDASDPKRGRVMYASVTNGPSRMLQRPDEATNGLKALVMLDHYDELKAVGSTLYIIAHGMGSIFELYRGQVVRFRCPLGIDEYELSYSLAGLVLQPLNLAGQSDGEAVAFTGLDADAAKAESFSNPALA